MVYTLWMQSAGMISRSQQVLEHSSQYELARIAINVQHQIPEELRAVIWAIRDGYDNEVLFVGLDGLLHLGRDV